MRSETDYEFGYRIGSTLGARVPPQGMNTLVFGWDWQVWTEDSYHGPHWEHWMKVCPRCHAGPLTVGSDDEYTLCDDCWLATGAYYDASHHA